MNTLGDEQTIMFDERHLIEEVQERKEKIESQRTSVVKNLKRKYGNIRLSAISERTLDQTIVVNRQSSQAQLPSIRQIHGKDIEYSKESQEGREGTGISGAGLPKQLII